MTLKELTHVGGMLTSLGMRSVCNLLRLMHSGDSAGGSEVAGHEQADGKQSGRVSVRAKLIEAGGVTSRHVVSAITQSGQ